MTSFRPDIFEQAAQSPAQEEDAAVQLEREMLAVVREGLGLTEPLASVFTRVIVDGMRARMGGADWYVPSADRRDRDAAIRQEFVGSNVEQMMRKYGLSRARIYAIAGEGRRAGAACPASSLETGLVRG